VAPFLGIVIGQMVSPYLVDSFGFNTMNLIYGVVGAVSAVVFLILAREAPPTPAGHEERVLMLDGLKHVLRLWDFYLLAFIGFVTNAIFNGVSTWVEVIVRPKGLSVTQAGTIGGVLLIGGIVGVFVLPPISDRTHKRKPIYLWGLILAVPFLIGLALFNSYVPLMITTALLGLFMMGIGPVAAQYATEVCYPAPEATSAGLYMLAGQLSVVAISIMGWSNETHGSFIPSLLVLAGLMVASAALLAAMKESEMMQAEGEATAKD
jgi:MFS family permease